MLPRVPADAGEVARFVSQTPQASWPSPDPALVAHLRTQKDNALGAYRADPSLVEEHANLELDIAQGGYGKRQLFELIQNGADAMVGEPGGKIHVLLTDRYLYCANQGIPIDERGVTALLHAFHGVKRGDEIGRFGLGFKSVLGVTNSPEFFCKTVSFGFSAALAAKTISQVVPTATQFPTLRLADLMDSATSAEADQNLRELMGWATTVVRLERNVGDSAWLHDNIASFPGEFLLFCSHVGSLVLEDRTRSVLRTIEVERSEDQHLLVEGKEAAIWRLLQTSHEPSEAAKRDAGELSKRKRLPLLWALPVQERRLGQFWAFFPLADHTTLWGVVNAPWKTNDDRTNLIEGKFNEELLSVLADLVAQNLATIRDDRDPGWHLDVMPARGKETRSWADEVVTPLVYKRAATLPSLPDQLGQLRAPLDLHLHPEGIPQEVLRVWAEQPGRPENWCHYSVETRDRRPRAERLFELAGQHPSDLGDWLAALSDRARPETFRSCVRVAAALVLAKPELKEEVAKCWILLDESGDVAQPLSGSLFLPASEERVSQSPVPLLHPALAKDTTLSEDLATLGVVTVTPELELKFLLKTGIQGWRDEQWELFWRLVRRTGEGASSIIIEGLKNRAGEAAHRTRLKVRTVGGQFKPLFCTLIPGPIVPGDQSRDSTIAIDTTYHRTEMATLATLGASTAPVAHLGISEGSFFDEYRQACVTAYYGALEVGSPQPHSDKLIFSKADFAGPIEPLMLLSPEGRVAFTEALMNAQGDLSDWTMQHETQHRYPKQLCQNPIVFAITKYGLLNTSLGARRLSLCAAAEGPLTLLKDVIPIATCSIDLARNLGLPGSLSALSKNQWAAALEVATVVNDDAQLGGLYSAAVACGVTAPERLRCRVGADHRVESRASITVVTSQRELDALQRDRRPVLRVDNEKAAEDLVKKWGLRPAEQSVRTDLEYAVSGPSSSVVDRFPALRFRLAGDRIDSLTGIELQPCSDLNLSTLTAAGKTLDSVESYQRANIIYWSSTITEARLLDVLNDTLSLRLSVEDRDIILQEKAAQHHRDRLVAIRNLPGHKEKLLEMVGLEAVKQHIPTGLLEAVEARRGPLGDLDIVHVAEVLYGIDLLREFKDELLAAGFQSPDRWAGSARAVQFVKSVGFDLEYAGSETERRADVVKIDGPSELPPLHEFQTHVTQGIRRLIQDSGVRRGLLALPTGAGKTRVLVQALVEELKDGRLKGPVLWIAESDELCEQAVQAWSQVWHALGPRHPLCLCRLWAGNEAEQAAGTQVVVATIQKLQGCVKDADYDWLADASCVVVDEAHLATEPSWTKALEWLGIGRASTRCPLLGLTATPFRGHSEEETRRLVGRFGGVLINTGLGTDPYGQLQSLGVLAQVRHQLLGGVEITLTEEEIAEIAKYQRLPASVAKTVAENVDRNRQLIDDICSKPRDWPIIVFGSSVEHAQTLAALLSMEGVRAAPLSATTDPGTRRNYVEKFKNGEIQVLTNVGVLAHGFDAPAVRAVYVAAPTFSPSKYQQMIGRGLRGPKNLGKPECLIVNILDNFTKFGTQLAFREFEYLWNVRV